MNHRTGKLTALDLDIAARNGVGNTADTLPWPQPTEPQHVGRDWTQPALKRDPIPSEPPYTGRDFIAAAIVTALVLIGSHFFPMGFAS